MTVHKSGHIPGLRPVGESGSWIGISTSPSLRQFHDLRKDTHVANRRAMPMAHVLWWPRRSLATLDRKSRQGRKAATVSIDAGAEVNRRGHHPNFARLQASYPEHRLAHDRSSKKQHSARAAPRCYARPVPARARVRAGPHPPATVAIRDATNPRRLPGNARASRSARAP